eukprot:gene5429-biopygen7210
MPLKAAAFLECQATVCFARLRNPGVPGHLWHPLSTPLLQYNRFGRDGVCRSSVPDAARAALTGFGLSSAIGVTSYVLSAQLTDVATYCVKYSSVTTNANASSLHPPKYWQVSSQFPLAEEARRQSTGIGADVGGVGCAVGSDVGAVGAVVVGEVVGGCDDGGTVGAGTLQGQTRRGSIQSLRFGLASHVDPFMSYPHMDSSFAS